MRSLLLSLKIGDLTTFDDSRCSLNHDPCAVRCRLSSLWTLLQYLIILKTTEKPDLRLIIRSPPSSNYKYYVLNYTQPS